MWGNVQNYARGIHRNFKSGIANALHMYNKGLHIAGDLSSAWNVAKT